MDTREIAEFVQALLGHLNVQDVEVIEVSKQTLQKPIPAKPELTAAWLAHEKAAGAFLERAKVLRAQIETIHNELRKIRGEAEAEHLQWINRAIELHPELKDQSGFLMHPAGTHFCIPIEEPEWAQKAGDTAN